MVILVSLIICTYNPILTTENIAEVVFLNTTLLLSLPILIEYYLGFTTYTNFANLSRWAGLVVSGFIVVCCIISYMGGVTFQYESNQLTGFLISGVYIKLQYWKGLIWILPAIALCDWVFSFGSGEVRFYKLYEKLDRNILEEIRVAKEESAFENRVAEKKKDIMAGVPKEE